MEPKLASKLTSEPEPVEHSRDERLLDIEVGVIMLMFWRPEREWQCFSMMLASV